MKFSTKTFLLFFVLVSLCRSHYEDAAPCSHSKYQAAHPPEFLDVEEDFAVREEGDERFLTSTTYNPIRIYANYDNLLKTAGTTYTNYVKNLLAPAVFSYFKGALKVKYPVTGSLKLASTVKTLCSLTTPSEFHTGVTTDYAILFNSDSENNTVVANSKFCFLASGSRRPLIGTTMFNRQMFKVANGDVILHEKNTYLLIHEMMHTFGFTASAYQYFVDANGKTLTGHVKSLKIAGVTHTVLDVPALTTRIRNFHGCSTIPGAIMEDGGGSGTDGSHLEKKFYVYETMSSGSEYGKRTSSISLALLEASGWYVVNYTYAEPYFFGQGEGCNFINGVCSTTVASFSEFCIGTARGCGFMGQAGGTCQTNSKTNGCKFVNPSLSYHCESTAAASNARLKTVEVYGRGTGSRCFTGTLNTKSSTSATSFCFKYTCVGSGTATQLQVILGSKTATCKKEGTLAVSGYYGVINCPDPLSFCNTVGKKYCPRNCMGRGKCVSNKCVCNTGFTGIDCALLA